MALRQGRRVGSATGFELGPKASPHQRDRSRHQRRGLEMPALRWRAGGSHTGHNQRSTHEGALPGRPAELHQTALPVSQTNRRVSAAPSGGPCDPKVTPLPPPATCSESGVLCIEQAFPADLLFKDGFRYFMTPFAPGTAITRTPMPNSQEARLRIMHQRSARYFTTWLQTLVGVKPSFSSSTLAGAEYPKRSRPHVLPLAPTRPASVTGNPAVKPKVGK
jgi:hypothetical protein